MAEPAMPSTAVDYFDILSRGLEARTLRTSSALGLANAERNRPFILRSISDLTDKGAGRTCLVVSGGPSMTRRNSIERLRSVMDKFIIVAADGGMSHCLRAGIVPHYVLTVDPHPGRIVRWYGDDRLTEDKLKDDYFRRQDLDEHFARNELERNRAQIELINRVGHRMKAILATSASEDVRRRCFDAGMDICWWNPIYDDVTDPNSITRALYNSNKVPCMNAGGNVGTAAAVFAVRVLNAHRVVMVGMDFSYYADTPIERTQYYDELLTFMREDELPSAFRTICNPESGEDFYTDPAYYWYRDAFVELFRSVTNSEIINATEGGILFGENISWMSIERVVEIMNKEDMPHD